MTNMMSSASRRFQCSLSDNNTIRLHIRRSTSLASSAAPRGASSPDIVARVREPRRLARCLLRLPRMRTACGRFSSPPPGRRRSGISCAPWRGAGAPGIGPRRRRTRRLACARWTRRRWTETRGTATGCTIACATATRSCSSSSPCARTSPPRTACTSSAITSRARSRARARWSARACTTAGNSRRRRSGCRSRTTAPCGGRPSPPWRPRGGSTGRRRACGRRRSGRSSPR